MLRLIGPAMKGGLPPSRRDVLIGELRNNDQRFLAGSLDVLDSPARPD